MRRMTWIAAIMLSFVLVLSACGTKDAESVVKDLDKFINNLDGYRGKGEMTLHSGQTPQTYQVDVSYSAPDKYRIELTNANQDITQIVLRNDEGVFVLTPQQNKIFRFQSDWPQKQGQVYLYQTLVDSILLDGSRQFTTTEDAYVFDVMAKYNSSSLARQKIWLSQDGYKPLQVEVSDANATVLVQLQFSEFEFDPKFEDNYFDTNRNMSANGKVDSQTSAQEQIDKQEAAQESEKEVQQLEEEAHEHEDDEATGEEHSHESTKETSSVTNSDKFTAMEPTYLPEGVVLKDMLDIEFGGMPGIVHRYEGDYSFSLIQTEAKDVATTLTTGDFVNLGFTIGQLTSGEGIQTLVWTYYGNQYRLSSGDLPQTELVKIAQSVQAAVSK